MKRRFPDADPSASASLREDNRRSWNAATRAHQSHKKDQAAFLAGGGSTLFPEELELLGPLEGRRLVHLQCNAGQDALSLARLGAEVTGVDFSDVAVEEARRLATEAGIPATFERADLYDWLQEAAAAGRRWPLAFSSYGCIGWLPDLASWARGLAGVLEPGGRFVLVEFHPAALVLDEAGRPAYPYSSGGEPLAEADGVRDYVEEAVGEDGERLLAPSGYRRGEAGFTNPHAAWEFAWGVGEVVQSLLDAGLSLERLEEYPYSNGCRFFEGMRSAPGRRLRMPEGFPDLPLMFGLVARRPGPGGSVGGAP